MTKDQKIIRAKVGLFELAKQLGNVSQACKMMGYSRTAFIVSRSSYEGVRCQARFDQRIVFSPMLSALVY